MTTTVVTHFDQAGYNELTRSPRGDLYKYLENRGQRLVFLAKRQVGKRSRELEASIGYEVITGSGFPSVRVYARSSHAYVHHEGSRPHLILPKHGRYLRFRVGGKIVYAHVVRHPGTKANRFLTDNLATVIAT